jgi:hypothetical protein
LTGQFVDANMLVRRVLGRFAVFSVLPHKQRLLLKGVKRNASRKSVAAPIFHELTLAFMDEFRKAQ